MKMMTAQQAAEKWNTSVRNVQDLCKRGRIPGAQHWGSAWMIPADAQKPVDARRKENKTQMDPLHQPLIRTMFLKPTVLKPAITATWHCGSHYFSSAVAHSSH